MSENTIKVGMGLIVSLLILAFLAPTALTSFTNWNNQTAHIVNESFNGKAQGAWINSTTYSLAGASASSPVNFRIINAFNQSSGLAIPTNNYSLSGVVVRNTTSVAPFNNWNNVTITYEYDYNNEMIPAWVSLILLILGVVALIFWIIKLTE